MDDIFDTYFMNDLNVENVETVCNICGGGHLAQECPDFIKGYHVEDTPQKNLSRSSIPNGLLILDRSEGGTCVITSQKFAKGTRFGPLYAEKSYVPLKTLSKFPLIIYPDSQIAFDDLQTTTASLQEIFSIRNIYLDISNEQKCNWMIHVNHARYSNEQNLVCYQENRQIYYTAIQDLELGDILKVWYSPCYAQKLGIQPQELPTSDFTICNNILQQVSIDYGINLNEDIQKMSDESYYLQYSTAADSGTAAPTISTPVAPVTDNWYNHNSNSSSQEIALPSINSLIKTSSPNYSSNFYDLDAAFGASASMSTPAAIAGALYDLNADLNGTSFDSALGGSTGSMIMDSASNQSNVSEMFLNETMTYVSLAPQHQHQQQLPLEGKVMDNNNNANKEEGGSGKVKFTCEQCNKKYMTKSNLEKHLRIHDLFMCVVCMKIHNSTDELKEHACFKKKAKNSFHCDVCLKVLSNSWSLQRHMKIHRPADSASATLSSAHNSTVLSVEDISSDPQSFEQNSMSSPPQHLHQIHQMEPIHYADQLQYDDVPIKDEIFDSDADLQEAGVMIEQSNIDGIVIKPIPCDDDFDDLIKIHSNNGGGMHQQPLQYHQLTIGETGELEQQQQQQLSIVPPTVAEKKKKAKEDREKGVLHTCVVCSRAFKNPNALEKHLRTVHTVNVLTTIMPAAGGSHNNVLKLDAMPGGATGSAYKTYKDSRKTVLHTSTPIKPSIAKALANKLTEKNNKRLMESAASGGVSPNSEYQPQYESYQIETLNVSPTSQQHLQQFEYAEVGSPTGATTSSGAGGTANNGNNTIIIISNVELNNSLIDTSQLFVNQDLKLYNQPAQGVQDDLPKLVPISSAKCNNNMYVSQATLASSKADDQNPESPQLFVIPKDKPVQFNCGGDASAATLIKHSHSSSQSNSTHNPNNLVNAPNLSPTSHPPNQPKFEPDFYPCDECDKTFKKKYQLIRHQETHGSIYYYCPFCDRTPVKAKSSLKKHFAREHPDKASEWDHPGTGYINELVVRDTHLLQQMLQKKANKQKAGGKRAQQVVEEAGAEQSTNNLEIAAAAAAAAATASHLPDRYFNSQNSSNSCSTLDSTSKNDAMLSFDNIIFNTGDQYQQQLEGVLQKQIIINATSTNLTTSTNGPPGRPVKVKKEKKVKMPVVATVAAVTNTFAVTKPLKVYKKKVKEATKRKYENISDDSTTNCDLSATSNNNLKFKSNNNHKDSLNLMNNHSSSNSLYDGQQQPHQPQPQQSYEFTNLPNIKKPKLPNGAIYTTKLTSNSSDVDASDGGSSNNNNDVVTPPTSSLTYNTNNGGNTFLATNLVFQTIPKDEAAIVGGKATPVASASGQQQPQPATSNGAIIMDNLFDNISMDDNNLLKYTLTSDDFTDDPTNNIIIDTGGDYIQEKFQNSFNQIQEKLDADDLSDFRGEQLKWPHDDDIDE